MNRERLPNSKGSKVTIIVLEKIKQKHHISFAKALDLICLESRTFNDEMDTLLNQDSEWFEKDVENLRNWAEDILNECEACTY